MNENLSRVVDELGKISEDARTKFGGLSAEQRLSAELPIASIHESGVRYA